MSDGPIPDLWYVVPGEQIRGTSTTAAGSWRLVFFPSKLRPGKYCIDLPGVTSPDEMLLFDVLDVAPSPSATGERPE